MASEEIYRHKKYDYESYRGPPMAKTSILKPNPEYLRFRKSAMKPKRKKIRKSALERATLDLGNLLKGIVIWFVRREVRGHSITTWTR